MKSHEIEHTLLGDDMQLVEVHLDPGETVIAEAGMLAYVQQDVTFESVMGDGTEPKKGFFGQLFNAGKRMLSGESLFLTHFTHSGTEGKRTVAFAAPYPGKIVALDLSAYGNKVLCQRDAFLCAAKGTKIDVAFTKRLGAGAFGGEGFILQSLQGDGQAFMHAGGTVIRKELKDETLRVDTGCVVGFTEGIDYSVAAAGNLKSMFFGGEGVFFATLSGTGTVWLQSLPFTDLARRVHALAPPPPAQSRG